MKTVAWICLGAACWAACSGSPGSLTPPACLADSQCSTPIVCAHRGLCGDYPENTLAGFLACQGAGVPMLEVDTRETADGEIVIMHDDTVDRTTDGEQRFPGRTSVDQLTREEFVSLVIEDQACQEPDADPDRCHPPTLEGLIERTSDRTLLFIDFKSGDPKRLAEVVGDVSARVILYDPSLEVLRAYLRALPGGRVMPAAKDAGQFEDLLVEAGDLPFRWVHSSPAALAELSAGIGDRGIRLYVDGFGPVDPYLSAAELSDDPATRAEFERQAWEALDNMIREGARGLGTNFAHRYAERLYPGGF